MSHPLENAIAALRRRVRRLLVLHGLAWVAALLVPTLLVLGLADYWIHFEDRGIRVICTLMALTVAGMAAYRYLLRPLASGLRDVSLALRIERRYPQLQDRLASTIQFLKQAEDDATAGSAALRKAVITRTTADMEQIDVRDIVDSRPLGRAAICAGAVCLVAAGVLAVDLWRHLPSGRTPATQIALVRLLNPLGDVRWPQSNHLQWQQSITRVALGQPFEAVLVDAYGARLPDDLVVEYRYTSDGRNVAVEAEKMLPVENGMMAHKPTVTRPFDYRAQGGDDRAMPWTHLEVVEPPAVAGMTVALEYPAYTALPASSTDKHIRALVGTRTRIDATTTKRIRAAVVVLDDDTRIEGQITVDGYGFTVGGPQQPFVIESSGSYAFDLEDTEGFHGGRDVRYEIRAVKDPPPSVVLERPDANIFVTADAQVPLRVTVKDNLAIHQASLVYARSDQSDLGEQEFALFTGPPRAEPPRLDEDAAESGQSRVIDYAWMLNPLQLAPGSQVTFHATAADYQPQTGMSQSRRLTVITPEELQDRIADRQAAILAELARILKLEQDARGRVSAMEIQWADVGRLAEADLDQLQGAELTQRQVERGLLDRADGVPWQIEGLLAELAANQLDSPDVTRRMAVLLADLDRLGRDHLPPIRAELTTALKTAQSQINGQPDAVEKETDRTGASLATAGLHQDAVIEELERILGDLSRWDGYRRFFRDVTQLAHDQQEVTRQTAELAKETLAQDLRDLTSQQRADLKKQARRQTDLAVEFDKIVGRMQQSLSQLQESEPLAAATIGDALTMARDTAASGKMRAAGDNVEQNQVAQAAGRQRQIAEDLEDILDVLANRREHELSRLVAKLREAEAELADIRGRQQGLEQKMAAAAALEDDEERQRELDRLARQQEELREEADRFARKLERLQARQAGESTQRASAGMSRSSQNSQQGDAGQAAREAGAAGRDLEEAQQQLAERRQQAEADLAMEQLAQLEDGLKSLRDRQQSVVEETVRLDERRTAQGQLTRGQSASVRNLSRQEDLLREETTGLAEKLSATEVFHMVLTAAADDMTSAVAGLRRLDTGDSTRAAEKRAVRRFEQLLLALEPDFDDQSGDGSGSGGQGGASGQPADGLRALAELKMLKLLQEDLNERTRNLDAARTGAPDLTGEQQEEYAILSRMQGRLAELLMNLTTASDPAPEDELESLPELDGGELDEGGALP